MNARDKIFEQLKNACGVEDDRKEPYPEYDSLQFVMRQEKTWNSLWEQFAEQFGLVHGITVSDLSELGELLKEHGMNEGYCDPALERNLKKYLGAVTLHTDYERENFERYRFGITRATGVIAETGTIVINSEETSSILGALTPWLHIAVVTPENVWADTPTAISHFGDAHSTIWVTGPSKTADVEGILVEGVHGPGIQVCCLLVGKL